MTKKVGYKRPPVSGQFKKGSSGNPKGRPKGSKNLATLLAEELDEKIVITENGKKKTITRLKAIVKRIVNAAIQGDLKVMRFVFEEQRKFGVVAPPEIRYETSPEARRQMLEAVEIAEAIMRKAGIPRVASKETIAELAIDSQLFEQD